MICSFFFLRSLASVGCSGIVLNIVPVRPVSFISKVYNVVAEILRRDYYES